MNEGIDPHLDEEENEMSKNKEMSAADAIVTRFDGFEREQGMVVRLFAKRKLLAEVDEEDVVLRRGDEWEDQLREFIDQKPRSAPEVLDFLSQEVNEESGDEEEEKEGGSVVPEKYRRIYGAAQNCGDQIAVALTEFVTLPRANKKNPDGGLDRARLRGVAEENGISEKLAEWEDRGLNGGLLRMNVSNVLRGKNRRGERVVIGDIEWPEDPAKMEARKAKRKSKPASETPAA